MEPQQYRPTLLDLPISVFKTRLENLPEGVTTLRRIVSRESNRPAIDAIRAEPDKAKQKQQKDQLRAFTSVARLHHRKKDTDFTERLAAQWPMVAGDVDKADNPGIDMAELKHHLSRLSYVLLCGYSVRGGLWFVVRLPDPQTPDTLAAHFRYLQQLFSLNFGVTLDRTKGGNPTDLRFVSYDAAPYINDAATVMTKTYDPPKPKPTRPRSFGSGQYSGPDEGELLNRMVRFAEGATEGNRHETLLKAATVAGGYVASGRLDEDNARLALETVASEWPNPTKSGKTIRDGLRYGILKPIYADPPIKPARSRPASHPAPVCSTANPTPERGTAEELSLPSVDYPASWDEPNAPGAVPTIKILTWDAYQRANR